MLPHVISCVPVIASSHPSHISVFPTASPIVMPSTQTNAPDKEIVPFSTSQWPSHQPSLLSTQTGTASILIDVRDFRIMNENEIESFEDLSVEFVQEELAGYSAMQVTNMSVDLQYISVDSRRLLENQRFMQQNDEPNSFGLQIQLTGTSICPSFLDFHELFVTVFQSQAAISIFLPMLKSDNFIRSFFESSSSVEFIDVISTPSTNPTTMSSSKPTFYPTSSLGPSMEESGLPEAVLAGVAAAAVSFFQ